MISGCDHDYVYQGRYGKVDERPLAGTGALRVDVVDVYFCRRCLIRTQVDTGLRGYQTYGAQPWEGEWTR